MQFALQMHWTLCGSTDGCSCFFPGVGVMCVSNRHARSAFFIDQESFLSIFKGLPMFAMRVLGVDTVSVSAQAAMCVHVCVCVLGLLAGKE